MRNCLQVMVVSSAHKNWVRLSASGGLEIIIQSNSRRFILVESSPNATFLQRELVIPQLVRFLVAVLAKREALYFSAVPFFDDLLDCMDSRGRVKSPRKVHVAPINELNHMLSNEREQNYRWLVIFYTLVGRLTTCATMALLLFGTIPSSPTLPNPHSSPI